MVITSVLLTAFKADPSKGDAGTLYRIKVTGERGEEWHVARLFRDFETLHTKLLISQDLKRAQAMPSLPPVRVCCASLTSM
jgi:hypothetical protein